MKHRRTIAAAAAAVAAAGAFATPAAAQAEDRSTGTRSLAAVLDADGNRFDHNPRDFDIVHRAVTTVLTADPGSAVGVLADGSQPLTAFLPTDRAFKRLVNQLTGSWPGSERATFNAVAGLGVDTVEAVLLYHVVPGATVTYAQAKKADGAMLTTAFGAPIEVNVWGGKVKLRDADRTDRNPLVIRSKKDINKGNAQIAHGIDRVLRPVDLP